MKKNRAPGCNGGWPFLLLLALGAPWMMGQEYQEAPAPHLELRKQPTEYVGPGREEADPPDLTEVLIGYFGPEDPAHPEAGDLWLAASLAAEEANSEGGYRGTPFRLVSAWSDNPWGSGISKVFRLAYDDKVWAFVGGIDGPSTHLVEQAVAKARLPLISAASTDKTVNLAHVPWTFSCLPGDHLVVPVLMEELLNFPGSNGFVVVSGTDHDSRVLLTEFQNEFTRRKVGPFLHLNLAGQPALDEEVIRAVAGSNAAALLVIARPEVSAEFVLALRRSGSEIAVFGGPAFGRRRFVELAGRAGEGVVFPAVSACPSETAFESKFESRFCRRPDFAACQTYDAVRLLVAAVRQGGLNRARIGDAIRQLAPWQGVAGVIDWDSLGQNRRPVTLATIKQGRVTSLRLD